MANHRLSEALFERSLGSPFSDELTEQVVGHRPQQFASPPTSRQVRKSANEANRNTIQLAANQSGGTGQFVGDRFDAGVQHVALWIAASTIVAQRFHAGDANAEFDQTFTPGPAE